MPTHGGQDAETASMCFGEVGAPVAEGGAQERRGWNWRGPERSQGCEPIMAALVCLRKRVSAEGSSASMPRVSRRLGGKDRVGYVPLNG